MCFGRPLRCPHGSRDFCCGCQVGRDAGGGNRSASHCQINFTHLFGKSQHQKTMKSGRPGLVFDEIGAAAFVFRRNRGGRVCFSMKSGRPGLFLDEIGAAGFVIR